MSEDNLIKTNIKYTKVQIEQALITIANACRDVGWDIAVPTDDPNDDVEGLLIGSSEYLQKIINKIDKLDALEKNNV